MSAPDALAAALTEAVGADGVITDERERAFFATDVYNVGERPIAVVRPRSVEALQAAVRAAADAGVAVIARGGGASYTDGYLARGPAVLIDTAALTVIAIDEVNAVVTVEAGVTWAALREALAEKGWRTPFWGPFSGVAATVAGSMSQNAISHGSGAYGASAPSALSFDVVVASGELLRTGSAAAGAAPVVRQFGPDLTGLFTGDCGALGVKARVTLPLLRQKPAWAASSFAFPHFAALHAGMRAAAIEQLDDEHFAVDAALSQGQIAREQRAGRQAQMAVSVMKNAKSFAAGVAQLAKMGAAGDRALKASEYLCHFIVEGVDEGEAQGRLKRLRAIVGAWGEEVPNTVPTVVRGMPFAPLFNTLGPAGERWAPLHGIVAHDAVLPLHAAIDALYEARAADMDRLGVWAGGMFECVGPSAFLYEIALYWPGARTVYHERAIDPDYLAKLPAFEHNEEAARFVDDLREALIATYVAHGASFFQIGKVYPYLERLDPVAQGLVRALKAELDPKGVMNPGALGL